MAVCALSSRLAPIEYTTFSCAKPSRRHALFIALVKTQDHYNYIRCGGSAPALYPDQKPDVRWFCAYSTHIGCGVLHLRCTKTQRSDGRCFCAYSDSSAAPTLQRARGDFARVRITELASSAGRWCRSFSRRGTRLGSMPQKSQATRYPRKSDGRCPSPSGTCT